MPDDLAALRERYSALHDDELQNLAVEGGLNDQARELLAQELRRRGIQDVRAYQQHLDRYDRDIRNKKQQAIQRAEQRTRLTARIGYILAMLILLMGLYVCLAQHNQKTGIGIIIAGVILFPSVWAITFAHRLLWRFLLRP